MQVFVEHRPHLLRLQEARLSLGPLHALRAEARALGYSLHASHNGELACYVYECFKCKFKMNFSKLTKSGCKAAGTSGARRFEVFSKIREANVAIRSIMREEVPSRRKTVLREHSRRAAEIVFY